jgi:hypothetical protein
MKNKLSINGRIPIRDLYKAKKSDEIPKYGDFLVRYTSSEIHGENFLIVEIFKEMTDDDIVSCLVWWNFRDGRGNLGLPQNDHNSYYMGGGWDTYKANNYEIEFLINKLKEEGFKWDFKNKQLTRIE